MIEVVFNANGDTRMTIAINITDDNIDEGDEAFALDITNTIPDIVQVVGPITAYGIIEDNDEPGVYNNAYKIILML